MRFFTMEWWRSLQGVQEGLAAHPSSDYFAHLDALRARVPPERRPALDALLALAVHDDNLCHLRLDSAAAALHISLDNRYDKEECTLAYSGVEHFASECNGVGFAGKGYNDLGYDEVDLSPTGAFVHRMLFSTGIELAVVFQGFELLRGNAAEPVAAPDPARDLGSESS